MVFVLDASVTASWTHVPAVWWFKIRNVLLISERRKRISPRETAIFLKTLTSMNIEIDRAPVGDDLVALARSHRMTVYDAGYLELAMRERVPLATLDKRLTAAAEAEGVPLIG